MIVLSPQQKLITKALLHTQRINIFADPGTGKTFSMWAFLEQLLANYPKHKVLIIAPKLVIQMNWGQELEAWNPNHKITTTYLTAPFNNVASKLKDETQVYFMNVDGAPALYKALDEINKPDFFTTVVMDESSILRNQTCYIRNTQKGDTVCGSNSQAVNCIVKIALRAVRYVNMTGSISPNGYENVWAQMLPVDRGESLARSRSKFRDEYMYVTNPGSKFPDFNIKPDKKVEVFEKIMPMSLYIKCEAEPPNLITHDVDIGEQALVYHTRMKNDLCAHVKGDIEDIDIYAVNQAARITKCLQLSNGFIYENVEAGEETKSDKKKSILVHDAKITYLKKLMADLASPLILVYTYEVDKDRIMENIKGAKLLPANPAQQDKLLPKWDRGEIPLLVLPAKRAAYGLNLHKSCHNICFFNPIYDYDLAYQVIERIGTNRQQKINSGKIPNVHFLLGKKTLDSVVYKNFLRKAEAMSESKAIMEQIQKEDSNSLFQKMGGIK